MTSRIAPHRTTLTPDSTAPDRVRQGLNVLLSLTQVLAIGWAFAVNASFSFDVRADTEPPVIPAGYAFTVWFVIYAGAFAYAVYQVLPAQRDRPLLRRIGWWTAGAFGASTLWALSTGLGWTWLTVPLMFVLFATLLAAFVGWTQHTAPTRAEQLVVGLPISIYLGYVTIATIANTASVLTQFGITSLAGLSPTTWAVAMLAVGGFIAAALTTWTRGNAGYAGTIIWALVGIVVANTTERANPVVAVVAGALAVLVALTWLRARRAAPAHRER